MAQKEDSKFTPQSAEAKLKGYCKIESKVITVLKNGMGLGALAALDFLSKNCGAVVKYEHVTHSNYVPAALRGNIILNSSKVK